MLEFCSGNRSSTCYCSTNFKLGVAVAHSADLLGIMPRTENEELWSLLRVGVGDFLYKNEIGYICYSTGSYGEARHRGTEAEACRGYFAMKSLWRTAMLPFGTVEPAHA